MQPLRRPLGWDDEKWFKWSVSMALDRRQKKNGGVRSFGPSGVMSPRGWVPLPGEVQDCCQKVKPPTGKYPWSLYRHCCTLGHIARLCGVDEKKLRMEVQRREGYVRKVPQRRPKPMSSWYPYG